jgi:hypothetical protein
MIKIEFKHAVLFITLILYSCLSLSLFDYERVTGDATLYLSIAQKYVNGDFVNAINGYWGPLLSWLMVPFLLFGSSHLFSDKKFNFIVFNTDCTIFFNNAAHGFPSPLYSHLLSFHSIQG